MKNETKTYPEINGMNLSEVRAALKLALVNYDSLNEEGKEELESRIAALEARRERLYKTQRKIDRETLALGAAKARFERRIRKLTNASFGVNGGTR